MARGDPNGESPLTAISDPSRENEEDRRLVRAFLRRRDEGSFSALYARHAGVVFALAARLSGSASEGEDLLQDVWIRAAERLAAFRWESSLRTWLCGILVHRWREVRRQGRRRPRTEVMPDDPRVVESAAEADQSDPVLRLDLETALRRLPDGYREIVVLHDVYGHTHAEIAELLEVEEGTSKSQLARGRGRLRELLGDTKERKP